MKFSKMLFFVLLGFLAFSSCKDDDEDITPTPPTPTVIDFGTAPASSLITTGTVEVITENTVRYHVFNFTNDPYTVTVIETENDIVIVDLGPAPSFAVELRSYVDAINKSGQVIITHNHGDHYGGAGNFADYDFYAESVVAGQLNNTTDFTSLYPNQVKAVGSSQTIGELDFIFDKISNAEAGENGYFYNEAHKILFVGDLVYNVTHPYIREYTPNEGEDEIDNWVAGLNTLKTKFSDYNYLFVGHNKYRTDIPTVIDENMAYLQKAQGIIKGTETLSTGGVATNQQQVIDELQVLYPDYLVGGLLLSLPEAFFPGDPGADWFVEGEIPTIVVEVTTFNLNEGVDGNAFELRDIEIEQEFASQQPGFLKRMGGVDADGKYVVMVFWETLEDADNSIAAFGVNPTVADYFAMIDGNTFSAERYTTFAVPDIDFDMVAKNVIEITTFNLNDGVDPAAFVARDAEIEQDFASLQPGFIRRTSGVDADGKYAVIVFWDSLADADNSIAAFGVDPTVSDYFAMIDGNTFLAERYSIFETMPQIPTNLTIDDTGFFPEDITIVNNRVFLSGLGDGTIRTFDLTETNASAQLFAAAEMGYAQSWGLTSDGSVVLNLLNNVDFSFTTPPGASKLVQYDMNGTKTGEWDLPTNTIGHTVSIVDGKYYVSDFGNPRIIEVDPTTGTVNGSWFTSSDWDPSIDGSLGGTIYDGSGGFYAYLGFKFWYIPISNGQPGTMQEVSISGLSGKQINADGITWGADQNTLYYSSNDTGDPADVGVVYKLAFSTITTATGSIVTTGLDDVSGIWYLENNGSEYLFVCESQFGGLFGINSFDPPFNIEVINL